MIEVAQKKVLKRISILEHKKEATQIFLTAQIFGDCRCDLWCPGALFGGALFQRINFSVLSEKFDYFNVLPQKNYLINFNYSLKIVYVV